MSEPWICDGIPDDAVFAGIDAWEAANADLENYVSGVTPDWDQGMIVCAIYKAMQKVISESYAPWSNPDGPGAA